MMPHTFREGERVACRIHQGMKVGRVRAIFDNSPLVEVAWENIVSSTGEVRGPGKYQAWQNVYYTGLERVALVAVTQAGTPPAPPARGK